MKEKTLLDLFMESSMFAFPVVYLALVQAGSGLLCADRSPLADRRRRPKGLS